MSRVLKQASKFIALGLIDEPSHVDRLSIDPDKVSELAKSINEIGLLQAIVVRAVGDRFEIIAGHRRFLAHKFLGRTEILANVLLLDDAQAAIARATENLAREDLTPVEEATIYKNLIDREGLALDDVAKRMGRSAGTIKRRMDLIKMPPLLQEAVHKKLISVTVAEELWPISDLADLEYYLSFAVENGCTKETARGWCKDWRDAKRRLSTAGVEGMGVSSPFEPRPYYVPCDMCNGPFEMGDETVYRVCRECNTLIKSKK